tara:strand:+ start:75 stop:521 length:447 start_codon:yes stop_codon:yes gene_type:complete
MNFRFKLRIQEGGKERWADANAVFAHLLKEYTKSELGGKKPEPYKDKVDFFFNSIDEDWVEALEEAYPNVDVPQELINAKMWLLSNTKNAKSDFKKFVNNWMAKSMRNGNAEKTPEDGRTKYEKYVPPVINEEDIASPEEIKEILRRR